MPTTMFFASPQLFCSTHTMASSGLVMQMTKALGAYFLMPAPTCSITLMLMPNRSSRLIPGLRGTPAVTMHTSAPSMASYELVPANRASNPSIGEDSTRSSALPWGTPSTTSNSTTSPSALSPIRCASVPPIWPAPINAILFRAMSKIPGCCGLATFCFRQDGAAGAGIAGQGRRRLAETAARAASAD